ncbi:unnamed protein product [Hydatigera taeniaeformis]|uniref:TPK_catalytic domain-containing protein n=1 Tax=Hydatigena taeniaeformis TaxID=6205 RepID=A0A0R3XBG1_HYDTA|nr:unnamed protein product [Hydatigera taeniaeformis]
MLFGLPQGLKISVSGQNFQPSPLTSDEYHSYCQLRLGLPMVPISIIAFYLITCQNKASISIFVDGFANIIYDSPLRDSHTPNFVSGDFDSIRPEVRKATRVIETPDQDASDFTKGPSLKASIDYIVGLYGSGGRVDHEFGIINSLFIAKGVTTIPVLLVTESSISYDDILDFKKLISTSNQTIDTKVEVVSSDLLLWSISNYLIEII